MNSRSNVTVLAVAIALLACAGGPVLRADDPAGSASPQSPYRVALDGSYRGGSLKGHGLAKVLAVTATAAGVPTTDVSADGVHLLHYINYGSNLCIVSHNGSAPSTSNAAVVLPPGTGFTSVSKSRVTTLKYYCPAGTTTVAVAY